MGKDDKSPLTPAASIAKDLSDLKRALTAGAAAFAQALGAPVALTGAPKTSEAFGAPVTPEGVVADDRELDSAYGDPVVRKDPSSKYWEGPSYSGVKLSECPPDYLDAFAKYKDACAYANEQEGKPEKAKYATYDRRDAARARGWAARKRAGWRPRGGAGMGGHAVKDYGDEDYDDDGGDAPF